MGQEHFTRTKEIADHTHPRHQRPFDDIERSLAIFLRLFGVDVDVINDAFDQRMLQSFLNRLPAPCFVFNLRFTLRFNILRKIDKAFGRVVAPIEQHIFHALAQFGLDLFINRELSCIHDRHVESGADRVKQKCRVHCFAHGVVAAERK